MTTFACVYIYIYMADVRLLCVPTRSPKLMGMRHTALGPIRERGMGGAWVGHGNMGVLGRGGYRGGLELVEPRPGALQSQRNTLKELQSLGNPSQARLSLFESDIRGCFCGVCCG